MDKRLTFDRTKYSVKKVSRDGLQLEYRAFEHIPYVTNPADTELQCLSIFVPEEYYLGHTIGGYSLQTAPIFLPNGADGYRPAHEEAPGPNFRGDTNATFWGLLHGYVVVSPGLRGRALIDADGNYIGAAPAGICDLKAAVRYLRYNAGLIPGDPSKIVSNGTSAGGAMSALLGSTGNHPDYEPYLKEMGAAEGDDSVFAVSCYCPITNLDHADIAYEWEFCGLNDYINRRPLPLTPGNIDPQWVEEAGTLTAEQQQMSRELKALFPAYINSLDLKDEGGKPIRIDNLGNDSFKDYVVLNVLKAVRSEQQKGTDLGECPWLITSDGKITGVDMERLIRFRKRMKLPPSFDKLTIDAPENELFGRGKTRFRHFTTYSLQRDALSGPMAEAEQIKMMNPMPYIKDMRAQKAKHYRIRHGLLDRETSLAISAILNLALINQGVDSQLLYAWGMAHDGDYDLPELFAWIDKICKNR